MKEIGSCYWEEFIVVIVKTVDQLLTSLGVKEHEFMINYDIFKKKGA